MRTRLLWTIKDSYSDYLDILKELDPDLENIEHSIYYLPYNKYKEFLVGFFKKSSIEIIRERLMFKMPYRLGYISIKKDKNTIEKRKPNFKIMNDTNKTVSHTNIHTNGYYFFYHWDKWVNRYALFKNKSYYVFKPNRGNNGVIGKRGLAKWILKCAGDPTLKDYDAPKINKNK